MANKSYHELTDKEWKIIERKLPPAKSKGRPQTDNRLAALFDKLIVSAILCK